MNPTSENDELSGPTRRAVEQVRSEPAPVESMKRTLNDLHRRERPVSMWKWRRYGVLAAAAACIAVVLTQIGRPEPMESASKPSVTSHLMVVVKVPIAKKDIESGIEITPDNFESYFDEVEIPQAIAVNAITKDQLLAAKDRYFYNKLLAGNWPTQGNLSDNLTIAAPTRIHTIVGRAGKNPPEMVEVPIAKKDVETGIEIDPDNFDFYFDEVEVPRAVAGKAMTKDQLLAAQDRHFYNKLLAGNWPTDRNLTSDVVSKPLRTHIMIGRVGNNPPVPYTYNLDTKTLITFAVPGPAEAASRDLPRNPAIPVTGEFVGLANRSYQSSNSLTRPGQPVPGEKITTDQQTMRRSVEEARRRLTTAEDLLVRGAISQEEFRGARETYEKALAEEKTGGKDPKKPQVWRRDGQAPTVARVYVGDGNSLELVSLHVTTTVEGPRARTVVDHVFRNPHARQLEGTFEYPLPTGASPSYFAMFLGQTRDAVPQRFANRQGLPPLPNDALAALPPEQLVKNVSQSDWGKLQEARIVGKQKALETYEEVVRGRIDPALLEYAGGNTFRGRVFPIPASGYNRVVFAYEELLPISQGKALYRFPLPDTDLQELRLTLRARAAECKDATMEPKGAALDRDGELLFTKTWNKQGPGGEAVFAFTPTNPRIQTVCGRGGDGGQTYVYARVRPELAVREGKTFAKHAAFLLDTSLSEHPDRFNINMKLLRKILESDADIEQFNILAFNVGAAWVEPKGWLPNTKEGRETAFARLDGLVLEGATDLGAALNKLAKPGFDVPPALPVNVFLLSDGQITWGEPDVATLTARFEANCPCRTQFQCYRTGIGADNQELFTALTRKGGGIFQCLAEADLAATAVAHKHECLQVTQVHFVGGPAVSDVLVAGRQAAVHPGGELVVVGKAAGVGKATLVVEGTFRGEKFVEEYPVELSPNGELAPRGWAEVAVASLLSLNDPTLDPLVTAYCQQFGVGSRVASFLVLENEADFTRLNLEAERKKTLPGDVGAFLDLAWKSLAKAASAKDEFQRFVAQIDPRVKLLDGADGAHVKQLLALLQAADYELPEATLNGVLLHTGDVPADYLKARAADRRNPEAYLVEAQRRASAGDGAGAVRVLSSIIEENPTRDDALRLVGYRLLDLEQAAQAARLFGRVQRQRPFEPHSYLDLARSLEQSGKYGLAAIQYEIVLAGTWHQRFHASLKDVAREDYGRMMRQAIQAKAMVGELADHFGDRLEKMDAKKLQADLRVSMSWNTDGTDVDLWVIEPSGEKCFYEHKQTALGGELSDDMTQGYGPERYQIRKAAAGEYTIVAHYYRPNANLLGGETHVNVVITRHAGTPEETVERKTVVLKKHNDEVVVAKIKF